MRTSNWNNFPHIGVNIKKCLSCHHQISKITKHRLFLSPCRLGIKFAAAPKARASRSRAVAMAFEVKASTGRVAWRSRWKLGSMVGQWVKVIGYFCMEYRVTNPLTNNFLTSWDIQVFLPNQNQHCTLIRLF